MNRGKLYGVINMGKNQLKMDEESYRAMVKRISGHESLKSCSFEHLNQIIDELTQKGFIIKPRKQDSGKSKRARPAIYHNDVKISDIRDKVLALWIEMHKQGIVRDGSDLALAAYCKKRSGYDHWHWISIDQASDITEGLKQWQSRTLLKQMLDQLKTKGIVFDKHELDLVAEIKRPKAISNYTDAENWRIMNHLRLQYHFKDIWA